MTDLLPYKRFERQIERIHRLLEAEESEVTWDDHIPDPDSPNRLRQIDVTIRRDGSLTLVECRLHKEPQDVTWIEELIGRRISLRADAVIAVSDSGFTKTAREKGSHHGVILRDFATLSSEEVQSWGKKWKLTVNYCEFFGVTVLLEIDTPRPSVPPSFTGPDRTPVNPMVWRLLLQDIMRKLHNDRWDGSLCTANANVFGRFLVDGRLPASIEFRANVRRVKEDVDLASIVAYADPISAKGHAAVARYRLGETEIIENCDDTAMIMDLSQIKIPKRCCFDTATVDAGRLVNMHVSALIGTPSLMDCEIPIQIRFGYIRKAA